ncbi:uncharacterized protein LOC123320459 [Coccinella septempunctata]|uniref:uncharacterized protein LOC123320459 n=1 Tax=Coccinella septempunctata TaxID=41139 RepID=UPI001D068F37|nr:uncharacterized protein LOC123320459 [Coccinella septempunctata]
MKLFQVLFRRSHMPNGHIHRGKEKLIKQPTMKDLQDLKNKLAIEEENMFYLRHSYLTPEQSHGHALALDKQEQRMKRLIQVKKEFKDDVTIESRLGHLRHKEAWD